MVGPSAHPEDHPKKHPALLDDAIAWEVAIKLRERERIGRELTQRYTLTVDRAIELYGDRNPCYLADVVIAEFRIEAAERFPEGLGA